MSASPSLEAAGPCLAVDATNRWITVGVIDGAHGVERQFEAPRESFQQLVPVVRDVLRESGVERPAWIATVVGPGSFTGLRISVGLVRNLAQLWDVPVRAVSSLRYYAYVIAAHATGSAASELGVLIDGKQQRTYACVLSTADALDVHRHDVELLDIAPDDLMDRCAARSVTPRFVADDADAVRSYLQDGERRQLIEDWPEVPSARRLCEVTAAGPARNFHEILPVYLRDNPARPKPPKGLAPG